MAMPVSLILLLQVCVVSLRPSPPGHFAHRTIRRLQGVQRLRFRCVLVAIAIYFEYVVHSLYNVDA
jgi:hypothetical protein